MFVALWGLNNIIAHRLLTAHYGVPLDNYRHQITNDFEKLLTLEGAENTLMITALIALVLRMHIEPTRLLEDSAPNVEFDAEGRFRLGSTGLDRDEKGKIERTIIVDEDDEDKEDPRKKNRQLKRKKQRQKRVVKAKTCRQADQGDANNADNDRDNDD